MHAVATARLPPVHDRAVDGARHATVRRDDVRDIPQSARGRPLPGLGAPLHAGPRPPADRRHGRNQRSSARRVGAAGGRRRRMERSSATWRCSSMPTSALAIIGYSMSPAHQGRGYATEAAGALVDRLFDRLHVHRVAATLDPANVSSARVLERLGFRYEGRGVKAAYVRGEWADDDRYAILADERLAWRERPHGPPSGRAARRDHSRQRLRGRTAGHPPLAATVRRDDAGVVHRRARARDHRRPAGRPVDAGDRGRR